LYVIKSYLYHLYHNEIELLSTKLAFNIYLPCIKQIGAEKYQNIYWTTSEQACLFPHLILSNGHWAHYRKQKHRPLEKPGQVLQLAIGHVKLLPKTLHNWQQQLDKKQLELRPSNFPRSPAFSANLVHPFWERSPVKYAPN